MRKLLILTLLIVGCDSDLPQMNKKETAIIGSYKIVEIDGCEYIISRGINGSADMICHKGNCKNHKKIDLEGK